MHSAACQHRRSGGGLSSRLWLAGKPISLVRGPPINLTVARIFCPGGSLCQASTASCKVGQSVKEPAPSFNVAAGGHRHRFCNCRSPPLLLGLALGGRCQQILDIQPTGRSAGAVGRGEPLRHDTLATQRAGVHLDDRTFPAKVWLSAMPLCGRFGSRNDFMGTSARYRCLALANSSFRIRRECRIRDRAAEKIERLLERAVILFVRWHVGLRARFFSAFRLEVTAE